MTQWDDSIYPEQKADLVIVKGRLRHIIVTAITWRVHRGALAHSNRWEAPLGVIHDVKNVWCLSVRWPLFISSEICLAASDNTSVKPTICVGTHFPRWSLKIGSGSAFKNTLFIKEGKNQPSNYSFALLLQTENNTFIFELQETKRWNTIIQSEKRLGLKSLLLTPSDKGSEPQFKSVKLSNMHK